MGAVVVCDVTRRGTLEAVKQWKHCLDDKLGADAEPEAEQRRYTHASHVFTLAVCVFSYLYACMDACMVL